MSASTDSRGHFDLLHFTESVLGKPRIECDALIIPVSGVFLMGGHPLQPFGNGPFSGDLLFADAVSSRRAVTEYIGDSRAPKGFKTPYVVQDGFTPAAATAVTQEFGFEGYQLEPSAWVDNWVVVAKSFEFSGSLAQTRSK